MPTVANLKRHTCEIPYMFPSNLSLTTLTSDYGIWPVSATQGKVYNTDNLQLQTGEH